MAKPAFACAEPVDIADQRWKGVEKRDKTLARLRSLNPQFVNS